MSKVKVLQTLQNELEHVEQATTLLRRLAFPLLVDKEMPNEDLLESLSNWWDEDNGAF